VVADDAAVERVVYACFHGLSGLVVGLKGGTFCHFPLCILAVVVGQEFVEFGGFRFRHGAESPQWADPNFAVHVELHARGHCDTIGEGPIVCRERNALVVELEAGLGAADVGMRDRFHW